MTNPLMGDKEQAHFQGRVEEQLDNIEQQLGQLRKQIDKAVDQHEDRLRMLENFRSMVKGGLTILTAIFGASLSYFFSVLSRLKQ